MPYGDVWAWSFPLSICFPAILWVALICHLLVPRRFASLSASSQGLRPSLSTIFLRWPPQHYALANALCLWANRSPRTKEVPIAHVQHQTP